MRYSHTSIPVTLAPISLAGATAASLQPQQGADNGLKIFRVISTKEEGAVIPAGMPVTRRGGSGRHHGKAAP